MNNEIDDVTETLADPNRHGLLETEYAGLTCVHCHQPVPPKCKFCAQCGQSLCRNCPECEKECRADVRFCGSCGFNIGVHDQEKIAAIDAAIEEAERLKTQFEFRTAVATLRRIRTDDYADHEELLQRREKLLATITDAQKRWDLEIQARCERATVFLESRNFASAQAELVDVPEPLRNEEIVRILSEAKTRSHEISTLSEEVREMIANKQFGGLFQKLDRLLEIRPDHQEASRVADKLRDQFCRHAQKLLKEHRYDDAMRTVARIPVRFNDDTVRKIMDAGSELQWLETDLKTAAVVDPPLVAIAQRLVEKAPSNKWAREIQKKVVEKARSKPKDSLAVYPNWTSLPKVGRFDCPVEWLGNIIPLGGEESEVVGIGDLAKFPSRMQVAVGLALQGIGRAPVSVNLMKNHGKRGVLRNLPRIGRRQNKQSAWGLDLSASALKAVKISLEQGKRISVEAVELIEHDKVLSNPGIEVGYRSKEMEATLRKLLDRHDLSNSKICVNMPGSKVLGRYFRIPSIENKKLLDDAVQYEIQHQIPISLDDLYFDYHTFLENADGSKVECGNGSQLHVTLVACKRWDAQNRIALLDEVGIAPTILQSECIALHNYAVTSLPTSEKRNESMATVMVDVGADLTNVVISTPNSIWFRPIPLGGDHFTRAIVGQFNLTFDQAEKVKQQPTKSCRLYQMYEALEPVFQRFNAEFSRTLSVYNREFPERRIMRIMGLGGGFHLHGLLASLQRDAGVLG